MTAAPQASDDVSGEASSAGSSTGVGSRPPAYGSTADAPGAGGVASRARSDGAGSESAVGFAGGLRLNKIEH
jgi:hypothetical protein